MGVTLASDKIGVTVGWSGLTSAAAIASPSGSDSLSTAVADDCGVANGRLGRVALGLFEIAGPD